MGNLQSQVVRDDSSLDASSNAAASTINHKLSRSESECGCRNDENPTKEKHDYPIMIRLVKFVIEMLGQTCGLFSNLFPEREGKNFETIEEFKANVDREKTYQKLRIPKPKEEEESDEATNVDNMETRTGYGSPRVLSRGMGGGEELRDERFKVKMVEVGSDGRKGGGQVGTKAVNGGPKK